MDRKVLSPHVEQLLKALQVAVNDICYSTRDGMTGSYLPACICHIVLLFFFSLYLQIADDAHNILTAISPGEPGLAGFPFDFPCPFIPGLCILLGQAENCL